MNMTEITTLQNYVKHVRDMCSFSLLFVTNNNSFILRLKLCSIVSEIIIMLYSVNKICISQVYCLLILTLEYISTYRYVTRQFDSPNSKCFNTVTSFMRRILCAPISRNSKDDKHRYFCQNTSWLRETQFYKVSFSQTHLNARSNYENVLFSYDRKG